MPYDDTAIGSDHGFVEKTSWSIIRTAQKAGGEDRRQALQRLIELYWRTVYFYIRLSGRNNEDSKDLAQQFFTHLLETDFIDRLDQEKGRFRAFLKVSLRNYLRDRHRIATAARRGGGNRGVSLDAIDEAERALPAEGTPPEVAMDREWRRVLIAEALGRLASDYREQNKEVHYQLFERYYIRSGPGTTHRQLADDTGLTPSQVNNYLTSARQRFRSTLTQAVADSVADPESLQVELDDLFGDGGIP
jgi:RNA polymerase sigma-70 factor (ECF subfamily)